MTLHNDPDMTVEEIASLLKLGWFPRGANADKYSEALGHYAVGALLAGRPTYFVRQTRADDYYLAPIYDALWPLPKLQWDALHIYRVLPRVFRTYDRNFLNYETDFRSHMVFFGDWHQYRIYFRVWSEEIADKFSNSYLIPDQRVNLRL